MNDLKPPSSSGPLDCVVIGYNETPFRQYEQMLRQAGTSSLLYRDLRYSFVEVGGVPMTWVDLMNLAVERGGHTGAEPFCSGDPPNLAAVYLTNFLRQRGKRAEYVNFFQNEKARLAELLAGRPLAVAITTTFYTLNVPVVEIVEFIRACAPEVPIVVGGPLVANHFRRHSGPELALSLADLGADIYVHESQGEQTLLDLVSRLGGDRDLSQVPNLAYFEGTELRLTQVQPETNDLDQVDIDWRGFASPTLGRTLQTRTARSCAFKCGFCAYPLRAGKLTLAGLDTLARELDTMAALGTVHNVVFIDDTFNVPLPRFKDICRLLIERDYGFEWYSYFRCSNSDEEAIDLMARAGCKGVFLGIESGSPTILANMNKAVTTDKYRRGIELLHDRGITTFGSFIVGFPGETDETVRETADFIRETPLDYYRAQLWYCEPGTPIHGIGAQYDLEGEGYLWRHRTMNSEQAANHVEALFRSLDTTWLPQWSFDFWFIPYALGRGLTASQFLRFNQLAHELLTLEFEQLPSHRRMIAQAAVLAQMGREATSWNLRGGAESVAGTPLAFDFERGVL